VHIVLNYGTQMNGSDNFDSILQTLSVLRCCLLEGRRAIQHQNSNECKNL